MKILLTQTMPEDTTMFEGLYEESLQMDDEFKTALLKAAFSNATWMYVDLQLAGEVYGLTPKQLYLSTQEEIPDLDKTDNKSVYLYSLSILEPFQGKGLGRLLYAYWLGLVKGCGAKRVIMHATSLPMSKLAQEFCANPGPSHDNWFESGRYATFYSQEI